MRDQILVYIESMIFLLLLLVAFITPLLFFDLTTEYFDIPKLTFLFFATVLLYGLWIISWVLKGKITFKKTSINIPLILLLGAIVISTIFSSSKYISIYGAFPKVHDSAVSWTVYILLFFVMVYNLKSKLQVKVFLQALTASAVVVSIITLSSFFGLHLPFAFTQTANFSTTGSSFSTTALLLMLIPLTFIATVKPNQFIPRPLAMVISILFGLTLILVGSTATYIMFFLVFVVSVYLIKDYLNEMTLPMLLIPFGLSVLTLMLVLIPFSGNKLNRVKDNFPSEPKLPLHISWAVSTGAFSKSPLFGTGPASYQYNYTRYRPVEFNNSEDWNYRFTSANNEFLRALGEWGILGLAALIFLTFSIVAIVRKFLISTEKLGGKGPKEVLLPSFAVGLFISAALLFISSSTLISIVITLMLLASFLALSENQKELELPDRFKVKLFGDKKVDILPILGLVIFLATSFYIGRKAVEAVSADYYHRLALTQASRDGGKTYEYLQKAEELNPYIDLYRIDMAQTNLALANLIVAQKGPTEENPEGNLTQEDIDTIRILLSQAINEAKIATELSPRSSRNWQVLGTIYKNITGISDNALTLSLDAYGRALENDPFNPFLRSQIAEVYYFVENYGQAVKFYNEAIKLKPDYVKGYYNLALTLRDSGDIQGAKENAEKAVELLRNDLSEDEKIRTSELLKQAWVKDFSLATDLLDEIKDTVEMNSSDNVSEFKNSSLPDLELSEPQEAIGI